MSDLRQIDWRFLLPKDSALTLVGDVPTMLLERSTQSGYPVLVVADVEPQQYPNLASFQAVVAVNPAKDVGARLSRAGFSVQHRFAIVPGLTNARWFVPLESRRAAWSMLRTYAPQKRTAKAAQGVAMAGARLGLPGWYRDQVLVATRELNVLDCVVLRATGRRGLLGVSTGTVGPARKPMGVALNADGTQFAFIRMADSEVGRKQIEREAEVLKALEALPSFVSAPKLLLSGEYGGWFFSVQTPLPGRPPPNAWTPSHDQFLATLKHGVTRPALETPLLHDFRQFALTEGQDGIFEVAWRSISTLLDGQLVEETVMHGDFAPWNLRKTPGGIAAFDWEYGVVGGIPGIDKIQHRFLLGMLVDGWNVDRAWAEIEADTARDPSRFALWLTFLAVGLKYREEQGFDVSDPWTSVNHRLLQRALVRGSGV